MKKKLLTISLLGLFLNVGYSAGIPVIDGALISKQIEQWAKELERWKKDYKMAKGQFESMTGTRDITQVLDLFRNDDFGKLSDQLRDSATLIDKGFDSVDPETRRVLNKSGIGEKCKSKNLYSYNRKTCEGQILYQIGNLEEQSKYIEEVEKTVVRLEELAEAAKKTRDLKETQDLGNQINIVLGLLQTQQTKNNIRIQNEARMEKLIEAKNEENFHKRINGELKDNNTSTNTNRRQKRSLPQQQSKPNVKNTW